MRKFITHSSKETKEIASLIAISAKNNIFALTGDLGAGKTTFVQGFAEGLEIKDKIISPTFVLIRQHKIPNSKKILFHIDLYRLNLNSEFKSLGLEELLNNQNDIILIEWAEKIEKFLPKKIIKIYFKTINETTREITVS